MDRSQEYFYAGATTLAEQLDSAFLRRDESRKKGGRREEGPRDRSNRAAAFNPSLSCLCVAETVIAILRDGRHIIGRLISFDHFGELAGRKRRSAAPCRSRRWFYSQTSLLSAGSLVLKEARERHIAGGKYCDVPMDSLYVVRGENLTLLGELVSFCLCLSLELATFLPLPASSCSRPILVSFLCFPFPLLLLLLQDEELDGKNPLLEKADLEEVGALEAEEQAAAVAAGFGAKLPRSPSTADSEIVDKGAGGSGSGSSEVPSLTLKSASKVASVRRAPKQASTIAAYWNMGES